MKKVLLAFISVMLVFTANAAVKHITPTSPFSSSHDNLRLALYYATAQEYDTIMVGEGIYEEKDNYLFFDKDIVILPEPTNSTMPIIGMYTYAQITNGASVTIKGLKFNGAAQGVYSYYFRFYDNSATSLVVDSCEFYGVKNYVFFGGAASHTNLLSINDCYFHDNTKNVVYFEASNEEGRQTCDKLVFTNSTVANTEALTNYTSTIDIRPYGTSVTDAIKVVVDHCTFYNNPTISSDHSAIRPYYLSDVTISNCIFAHPTAYDRRATCCYGGTIRNCLTYNLTYDSGQNGHRQSGGAPTLSSNFTADPLFNDLANNKYSFDGNYITGSISPARGAAIDGTDLGDPRWYTDVTLPESNFASPGYTFRGNNAQLTGNIFYSQSKNIYYSNKNPNGSAKWRIHATRAGLLSATLHITSEDDLTTSGHNLQVEIFDKDNNSVGSLSEGDWYDNDNIDKELSGGIVIPDEGDYTVVLTNNQSYSTVALSGFTLTYVPISVVGSAALTGDAWNLSNEDNDMEYDAENEKFVLSKEKVYYDGTNNIEFKIAKNRAYAFPDNNWAINSSILTSGAGYYDIVINYTLSPENASVTATYLGPKVLLKADFYNNWEEVEMDVVIAGESCSLTRSLSAGNHSRSFMIKVNEGNWVGYNNTITRNNRANWTLDDTNNPCSITADLDGDYVFRYVFSDGKLDVEYPLLSREVTTTNYTSLCAPYDGTLTGATAYELVSADESGVRVRSVDAVSAGVSYLVKPDAVGTFTLNYTEYGGTTITPVDNYGATALYGQLVGDYVYNYDTNSGWRNNFILLNDNQFHQIVSGGQVTIHPTRAYLHISGGEFATVPALRIIEGENGATAIQNLEGNEAAVKFIQNGQLFILKNGVVYDMTGRVVR